MSRTYKSGDYLKMDPSRDVLPESPLVHNRLLVLCIDRDDDIGSKGGVATPIIGKEPCINAGIRLDSRGPRRCRCQRDIWSNKNISRSAGKGL